MDEEDEEPGPPADGGERHSSIDDYSIESLIGEQLRIAFADIANEPIPVHFTEILDRLVREAKSQ